MGRSFLGILAGAVIGFVVPLPLELMSMWLFPLPPGIDPGNRADMARAVASMPAAALLLLLLGWWLAAGIGTRLALKVAGGDSRWPGLAVGGLILAATLHNLWTIPHPSWVAVSGILGIVVVTVFASGPRAAPAGAKG